jgi:hypothetical protein
VAGEQGQERSPGERCGPSPDLSVEGAVWV